MLRADFKKVHLIKNLFRDFRSGVKLDSTPKPSNSGEVDRFSRRVSFCNNSQRHHWGIRVG